MTVAVYRCVSGGYDKPRAMSHPELPCEFYDLSVPTCADPRTVSYWYKFHPQSVLPPNVTHSVWIDGNMTIINAGFFEMCLEAVERSPIGWAAWSHPDRFCIFQEAQTLKDCGLVKWPLADIERQVECYRTLGYPGDRGLFALGCIARAHEPASHEFDEAVWDECQNWNGSMDQIVVPYVEWRLGTKVATFDANETDGRWITIGNHG